MIDNSTTLNLAVARELIGNHRPRRRELVPDAQRSAVSLMLAETAAGLEVLMIRRAIREGDPWSGHMAFPGGRTEPGDEDVLHTARRETVEEVGFDPVMGGDLMGKLSEVPTRPDVGRRAMIISPFVFELKSRPAFTLNEEVDETHWIPLAYLAESSNRQRMHIQRDGVALELPCYHYSGCRIWGLSLLMLDELLEVLF